MTVEKEGFRIGDIVELQSHETAVVVGFMPESYVEQNIPVPNYYFRYPEEWLCIEFNNWGHELGGLDNGTRLGIWIGPNSIIRIISQASIIKFCSEEELSTNLAAII